MSEKKGATRQSFIRKEITTYRIGTLVTTWLFEKRVNFLSNFGFIEEINIRSHKKSPVRTKCFSISYLIMIFVVVWLDSLKQLHNVMLIREINAAIWLFWPKRKSEFFRQPPTHDCSSYFQ